MRGFFTFLIILGLGSLHLYSQVTIGSGNIPVDGALLDIKENTSSGANSTRGFLFPRVSLTTVNALNDISGVDPADATAKLAHTGLSVYNTNISFTGGAGLNMWDGEKWVNIQASEPINTNLAGIVNPGASLLSANLISPATNWQVFPYSTALIDTNGEYNTTSGVFTAKHNGLYDIKAQIAFSDLGVAATYGVAIYKKAAAASTYTQLSEDSRSLLLGASVVLATTQGGLPLNAGDQIVFAIRRGNLLALSVGNNGTSYATIKQR